MTAHAATARRRASPPVASRSSGEPGVMLATLIAEPFDDPAWVFEPKFDGLRVLGRFDGRKVSLLSRNGAAQELRFPDVADALRTSLARPAVVDGELVCLDARGRSSFRALQQRFHLEDPAEIRERMARWPAFLYLFDLLALDGEDLTRLPLAERKKRLRAAVRWSEQVRWTTGTAGAGTALWKAACARGDEGIVGKRLDSAYAARRDPAWVKIKCVGRQEFVVGGFTDPQRSRVGLGALLVGYYDDAGRLRYAGKVGTGYTRETLLDLRRRLGALERRAAPFDDQDGELPRGEGVHWVRPKLVAEIAYGEWTQHGRLRQPRFEGLRPDKRPEEIRRERAAPARRTATRAAREAEPPAKEQAMKSRGTKGTAAKSARARDAEEALRLYAEKRRFARTPEPPARGGRSHAEPLFVVQEHHASHLHYDFRLEDQGVLKSWAVPKEPSLDPSLKRLAVEVEDHPLAYASFEGRIPKGEYGAGTVRIWDHGTFEPHARGAGGVARALEDGRLDFDLHGERLRGGFTLVRMGGRAGGKHNWLLIKRRDALARGEPGGEAKAPARAPARRARASRTTAPSERRAESPPSPARVVVTHPDKVMYPDAGYTKADVVDYYRRVAPRLLPYLKDRPVTLERVPTGVGARGGTHFWQKNTPESYPAWIPRAALRTERGTTVRYTLVNDLPTLLYLVNQGALTFHPWFSRVGDLDRPDYVLFDLDPGGASFADAVVVARALRDELAHEDLEAFVKTSGKRGLHVLAPWRAEGGFDEARAWARELAGRVAAALPDRATLDIRKARRGRRVYIDVLQNARGHHAVPPYVLRAVPGAPVSMPLRWQELTPALDPASFDLRAAQRRIAAQKRDPMAALLEEA